MESDTVIDLLGRQAGDAVVEAALQRHGVARRPELGIDMDDADGPVVDSQDWVGNLSAGIEFGFQEEGAFMGLDRSDRGIGPLILTEIYFYGDRPGTRAFPDALPLGLALADDRATVRAKMALLGRSRRSHVRDTWDLPTFRLTVAYADDDARIDFVVCMLRTEPPEAFERGTTPLPAIDVLLGVLGQSTADPVVRSVLVPLGLDRQVLADGSTQWIDFRRLYGLLLHVRKSAGSIATGPGATLIHEIEFLRAGELESRGWNGELPFDLQFDDSPETAFAKIGLPAASREEQDFAGETTWNAPAFTLRVTYSTMENVLLRVSAVEPSAPQRA